ncbi:aryl-sulfate sulfotransferase [Peptococcus simiae]|uniref:aryl-sulfate sulfotransferase n=1 Tax=Peptococcus simiae TaxID=1643805 RepID=UPI00397EC825
MPITCIEEKHLINRQANREKEILENFAKSSYTLENPYVIINPYFINPLSALVCFKTEQETSVEIVIKGKTEAANFTQKFSAAKEHILPIVGLYDDYQNTVEIALSDGRTADVKIPIKKQDVNRPLSCDTDPDYFKGHLMFLSAKTAGTNHAYSIGVDYTGDVRWMCTEIDSWNIDLLANGHILYTSTRTYAKPYFTVGLFEMDLIGKIYTEYRIPGGFHHDAFELPNGNILAASNNPDPAADSVEDYLVEIDRRNGQIVQAWNLLDLLPRDGGNAGDWTYHDWFHNNAVWYDEKTNSISLSGRHKDAIVNIDYGSGQLNWILGDPTSWPESHQPYLFSLKDPKAQWHYEQHAVSLLPNGDVLLFDNGTYRSKGKDQGQRTKPENNFSRGLVYHLDKSKMEASQVWEYGKELGSSFYSPYISNATYYADNHFLVHSGGIGTYKGEHTDTLGAYLLRTYKDEPENVRVSAITLEVLNNEVVYKMEIEGGNYYRAVKMAPYQTPSSFKLGAGSLKGTLGKTATARPLEAVATDAEVPEKHHLQFIQEEDRLAIKGDFKEGSTIGLRLYQLDRKDQVRHYSLPTQVHRATTETGPTDPNQLTSFDYYIHFDGLSGDYAAFICIEGCLYDTKQTIRI